MDSYSLNLKNAGFLSKIVIVIIVPKLYLNLRLRWIPILLTLKLLDSYPKLVILILYEVPYRSNVDINCWIPIQKLFM